MIAINEDIEQSAPAVPNPLPAGPRPRRMAAVVGRLAAVYRRIAASRPACWARAVWGWFPLTPLGLVTIPLLVWLTYARGLQQQDRIILILGACGTVLAAFLTLCTVVSAICVALHRPRGGESPLDIEADMPFRTGYALGWIGWNPLVKVELKWELPPGTKVEIRRERGAFAEIVTAGQRGIWKEVIRRYAVTDMLGLARIRFRRRDPLAIKIKPRCGELREVPLLQQMLDGDEIGDPRGKAEGDRIEMRRYVAGDPLKLILWKVYARTGKLLVRMPERAIAPRERTLAYFVAADADEPAAGIARSAIESGALGNDFLFAADGSAEPVSTRQEAVEQLVRAAGTQGGAGLGFAGFLARGAHEGRQSCILFVPHRPGEWLERIARQVGGQEGAFKVVVGTDGISGQSRRHAVKKLLFRSERTNAAEVGDVLAICRRLQAAGAEVIVVDRESGQIADPARYTVSA